MSIFKNKSKVGALNQNLLEVDSSTPVNYSNRVLSSISYNNTTLGNTTDTQDVSLDYINKWRSMVNNPYVSFAVNDIINEMNSFFDDNYKYQVKIDLSECEYSSFLQGKIQDEWEYLMETMDITNKFYNILKDWYIDGTLYLKLNLDEGHGVLDIEELDPIFLKKSYDSESDQEYYIYNNTSEVTNIYGSTRQQIEENVIPAGNVINCNSGIMDDTHTINMSFLDPAYVPLNQLTSIEDSLLVYRIARAPARRVFYIDTGMLPKSKAEAYMREVARNYKQEINYDPSTGKFSEQNIHLSLLDDLFLPRSGDAAGTEVTQLEGNSSFAESLKDLDYFRKKLFRALCIPFNRWGGQEDGNEIHPYTSAAEVTRDELKYAKYIESLRNSFNNLFYELLKKHLLVKHLTNEDTFEEYRKGIKFLWAEDSKYKERGALDILTMRLDALDRIEPYIESGYFSKDWVLTNILKMTDDDKRKIKKDNKLDPEAIANENGFGPDEGGPGSGGGGFDDIANSMSGPEPDTGDEEPAGEGAEESINNDGLEVINDTPPAQTTDSTLSSVEQYLAAIDQEEDPEQEMYNNISKMKAEKYKNE